YVPHPHLRSFPTRRSSDLALRTADRTPTLAPRTRAGAARKRSLGGFRRCLSAFRPGAKISEGREELAVAVRVPFGIALRGSSRGDRKSTRLNSSHQIISYA